MASKIWNLREINVGGTQPQRLWWNEDRSALPAQTTSVTGWTVAKTIANNYRLLAQGQEVAGFSTTIVPNNTAPAVDNSYAATAVYTPPTLLSDVESISTLYEYNGAFPAGTWTFAFPVISVTSAAATGAITMRVFKGTRSGTAWSGVTELTSAMLQGSTTGTMSTTVAQTSTVSWTAPAFRLNNEFLICKIGWRIITAGGNNGSDVLLRWGTGATMTSPTATRERNYNIT